MYLGIYGCMSISIHCSHKKPKPAPPSNVKGTCINLKSSGKLLTDFHITGTTPFIHLHIHITIYIYRQKLCGGSYAIILLTKKG